MLEAAVTDDWRTILGRFHGGFAWLPVGLLAAVTVAEFVAFVQRDAGSRLLRSALWITTALAAAAAAITGWLLADTGAATAVAGAAAASGETAARHRTLGLALAALLAAVAIGDVVMPRRARLAAAVARTGGLGAAAGLLVVTTLLGVASSRGAVPMADALGGPLQPAADALTRLADPAPDAGNPADPADDADDAGAAPAAPPPLAVPASPAPAAVRRPAPIAAPSAGPPPPGLRLVALDAPAPPWTPGAGALDRPGPLRAEVDAASLEPDGRRLLGRLAPRVTELVATGGDAAAWAEVPVLPSVATLRLDDPGLATDDAAVILRRTPWAETVLLHETAVDAALLRPLLGLPALERVTIWGTRLDAPTVRATFAALAPEIRLAGSGSAGPGPFGGGGD